MAHYTNKMDADAQITMEEGAAAMIFGRLQGREVTEELANELGKRIVLEVLRQFRTDLVKD